MARFTYLFKESGRGVVPKENFTTQSAANPTWIVHLCLGQVDNTSPELACDRDKSSPPAKGRVKEKVVPAIKQEPSDDPIQGIIEGKRIKKEKYAPTLAPGTFGFII
jgi:hypothetical protein